MDAPIRIRRRGHRSGLLGLVLVAATLVACSMPLVQPGRTPRPPATPVPTFDAERTGFDGLVLDEDGEPIAGVRLVLSLSGRRGTAATEEDGTFFDRGLIGEIGITASLEGYRTEETTVTVVPNEIAEVEIVLVAED
jgi:hypothetical protein